MGDQLEQHGNLTTYNLESVLHANISSSRYSAGLERLEFNELLDEMYSNVEHVEPWMSGNARGPSTAFCCLYRLFQLKPTRRQVRSLLEAEGAPHVRALGLLYLRYVGDPKSLWAWFEEVFGDAEQFSPSPDGKAVTMGLYARELLLDQFYFETIFPRIPEVTSRAIKDGFSRLGFATQPLGCAGAGGSRRGDGGGAQRGPPSVKAALAVSLGQRAPHVSGGRESGRGFANIDPSLRAAPREAAPVHAAPPARVVEREREHGRDKDHGRDHRERRRSRSRSRERRRSRSRSRDRRRSRSRERRRSRSPARHGGGRGRSRSRERERDWRGGGGWQQQPRQHEGQWRGAEPGRQPQGAPAAEPPGRSASDVFRAAPVPPPNPAALHGRY